MLGSRAIWHKGWKAVSVHPTIAGWGHFDEDRWELYHTDEDPTESHDLAAEHPSKLQELVDLWFHLAGMYNGLPLIDKTAVEVLADPTRPQVAPPRDRYVYYPDAAEVPESAAVNIRNRSYTIAAEVNIDSPRTPGRAVLTRRPLRRPLAVREGPQAQVRLQLRRRQRAGGRVDEGGSDRASDPPARHSCARATAMPTTGTLSLFIDDEKVGEGKIMTQPGNFSLVGEGLNVGRDPGRAGDRRLRGGTPVPVHRRHDQGSGRRRLRRAIRRFRARSPRDDEAGIASRGRVEISLRPSSGRRNPPGPVARRRTRRCGGPLQARRRRRRDAGPGTARPRGPPRRGR